jgi:radical SAM-linked protein
MIPDNTPIKQRLHIRFGKFDALIYTSNLDVAKLLERVMRRANLPILYSEGFNPRPRIALATALPLGMSSECELLDVSLREVIDLTGLKERLEQASPPGLRIYDIQDVPVRSPSLTPLVRSSEYRIQLDEGITREAIQEQIDAILAADKLEQQRERKGKSNRIDVRPLVYDLHLDERGDLIAHLAAGDQGNLRPDELLETMGLKDYLISIHRFALHLGK